MRKCTRMHMHMIQCGRSSELAPARSHMSGWRRVLASAWRCRSLTSQSLNASIDHTSFYGDTPLTLTLDPATGAITAGEVAANLSITGIPASMALRGANNKTTQLYAYTSAVHRALQPLFCCSHSLFIHSPLC